MSQEIMRSDYFNESGENKNFPEEGSAHMLKIVLQ